MKKVLGLVILLALPFLSYGQARNTGIKLKGPIYQDAVLILTRTQIQVRTELPLYVYAYANDLYKNKPEYPLYLGIRYERLGSGNVGFGVELEYNSFQAKTDAEDGDKTKWDIPKKQETLKVSPFVRMYFRKNRKMVFRGLYLQGGLSLMNVSQIKNVSANKNIPPTYTPSTLFGITTGIGINHTFGPVFTGGFGTEATFCGQQFIQEGFTKIDFGDAAIIINPIKFYIGARF
jgi:hypothetical protein